ncbi:MAG TPA: Crp/Fnr family transcriptional regulator [Thermoanaerobaculia bacterium]|nr:Crp/Fnr family transcriptional regulator [Thermoanaerobaculia bacterium]
MPARAPIPFQAIPVLALLRPEDRAALAPECELAGFEKGAVIFAEGDTADRIHFLVRGRVKIVKAGPDRDLIIEVLGPGEPLGTVAVFERRPFPATAVALEPSSVLSVPEHRFFGVIEKNPEITRRLLAGLTLRLITLNRRLADMTGSVEYRCARLFETLAARIGQPREGGGVFLPLPLSRQEIADLTGTTVETAIRIMSRWQKSGLVETDRTGFLIRDPAALQQIAPEQ